MENMKQCPYCGEEVRAEALICRYCFTDFQSASKDKSGYFVRVRIKTGDTTYSGDVFVPDYLNRVSDVMNDKKPFLILTNTMQETRAIDVPIGFIAINKNLIQSIRLADEQQQTQTANEPEGVVRMTYFDPDPIRERKGRY